MSAASDGSDGSDRDGGRFRAASPNGLDLASRLAASEATAAVALAAAMRAGGNDAVACERLGDGALISLGRDRYLNRAIGVGPDLDDDQFDAVDRFFASVDLPAAVQLSARASTETVGRLHDRGLRPQWFRAVYAATLPRPSEPAPPDVSVVAVGDADLDVWLDVLADGNGVTADDVRPISDEFGRASHRTDGAEGVLAFVGGRAVGCGSLQVTDGVGWLGVAATRPGHRRRGVQRALLHHRFELAAARGCDVVAATAMPNGASARNLLRLGLTLVDVQLVVCAG